MAADVMGRIKYQESTERSEEETFCIKYENIFDTLTLFKDSANSQQLSFLGVNMLNDSTLDVDSFSMQFKIYQLYFPYNYIFC